MLKLEELAREMVAKHQTSNGSTLSVITGGKRYIYACDPVSGEVTRMVVGESSYTYTQPNHGLGAVRD